MDDHVPNVLSDCAWVVAAPLGWPVVPEVKIRSETSSGWTACARAAVTAGSVPSPARRNSTRLRACTGVGLVGATESEAGGRGGGGGGEGAAEGEASPESATKGEAE